MRKTLPILLVAVGLLAAPRAATGAACTEPPAYDSAVTSPESAMPGFPDRLATTAEINAYVQQIAGESERVQVGQFATSWNGTPMYYAMVTREDRAGKLDRLVKRQQLLRDPRRITGDSARDIADHTPAMVWYTGNVHGGETSGADAALSILYELAARTDCAIEGMLDELNVGIIATQNPDGRDVLSRTNTYGFDMNRDWFAWSQRETRGKIDLLRRYPPVLFVDAHEMGSSDYFFPPNADPIYHEISEESIGWINDLYGPALAAEFQEREAGQPTEWQYFNYSVYDLFYMGYGDTVPTTAFTAAGMTFEKGTADTFRQKWIEQFVAGMTTLETAAANKDKILRQYHRAHRAALRDGREGRLEPNAVFADGSTLELEVPNMRVRHYFIKPGGTGAPGSEVRRLLDRLLTMGVEIYRLDEPVDVGRLRRHGYPADRGRVGKGWYWIPMNQPQKRWIQTMLHEDTYVPFPYFYDVTAWSQPLLLNVDARFTGARLSPAATRITRPPRDGVAGASRGPWFRFDGDSAEAVAAAWRMDRRGLRVKRLPIVSGDAISAPSPRSGISAGSGDFSVRAQGRKELKILRRIARRHDILVRGGGSADGERFRTPRVALFAGGAGGESLNHLRFTLERTWGIPFDEVTGPEIAAGALDDADVLLVPGINTLDLNGVAAEIEDWIAGGGTYVGTARGSTGGTSFAVSNGWTSSTLSNPSGLQIPGTMFRVRLDRREPISGGTGRHAYWFHLGERVLSKSSTGRNLGVFPGRDPAFFTSGYAEGANALKGTAALVEEDLGDGRVVLFSGEPNYRAYTDGVSHFLANALSVGAWNAPSGSTATDVTDPAAAPAVAAAARSADGPGYGPGRPMRIEVPASEVDLARGALERFGRQVAVERAGDSAFLVIRNDRGLDVEEHPFMWKILPTLERAGVTVRSAVL